MAEPSISVVFATRNRLDYLRRTVQSLLRELSGRYAYELVIVDGGSTDGTLEYLADIASVRVVHEDAPRGCCYAFDLGLRAARGHWVCWLNDDIEMTPGAFDAMLAFMTAPENAQVGMGAFPSSRSRQERDSFVVRGVWDHPVVYADFGFLRRELLADLGYLDLGFRKFAWDPDLALRVWERGLRVAPCPGAHVVHFFAEDALRKEGDANLALDTERLMRKWEGRRASCRLHRVYQDEGYCRALLAYLTGWARCQLLLHLGQERGTDGGLAAEAAALFNPGNALSRRAYYAFGLELMRRRRFADALQAFEALHRAEGGEEDTTRPWYACKAGEALLRAGQPERAMPWFTLAAQGGVALARLHLTPTDQPLRVAVGHGREQAGALALPLNVLDSGEWDYYFSWRKADRLHLGLGGDELGVDPRMLARMLDASLAPGGCAVVEPRSGNSAAAYMVGLLAEELACAGFVLQASAAGGFEAGRRGGL